MTDIKRPIAVGIGLDRAKLVALEFGRFVNGHQAAHIRPPRHAGHLGRRATADQLDLGRSRCADKVIGGQGQADIADDGVATVERLHTVDLDTGRGKNPCQICPCTTVGRGNGHCG